MAFETLKSFLPNRAVPTRVLRGPFRGARIVMNPHDSLRKVFGLYEHELNPWLENALPNVVRVIDVGANDGYFTFGCAAAFRRAGISGEIIAVENQDQHILTLRRSCLLQGSGCVNYQVIQACAGSVQNPGFLTLDSLHCSAGSPEDRSRTLIKIDVEGAEMDVIAGAQSWIRPTNWFAIEVHYEAFLSKIKAIFVQKGHILVQVNQQPLRFLGRENREENNWWLVSETGQFRSNSLLPIMESSSCLGVASPACAYQALQ